MDFSKIPTEDLQAIQAGKWDKVSTPGLQEYQAQRQHQIQAQQQAQNPQQLPDAADKAAQGNQPDAKITPPALDKFKTPKEFTPDILPGQSESWAQKAARLTGNPNFNDAPDVSAAKEAEGLKHPIELMPPMALPAGAAPAALSRLAGYLGKGGLGPVLSRIGLNTGLGGAQGAINNPEDRLGGAARGAVVSGTLSTGLEGLGGLASSLKRMYDTSRMAANPVQMQNKAIEAVTDATGKLRESEAANLQNQLGGKTLKIDTTRIRGISPEIDNILQAKAGPYGDIASEVELSATDANKIRSLLDQEMTYRKLGPFAQNAETATQDARIKPLADQLRGQVHGINPEVSSTFDDWSENLNAARNLEKRAETAPVTVLTSPSVDRRALIQKVDDAVGTKLGSLGKQLNSAKNLSNAVHDIKPFKALGTLGLEGARGLSEGSPNLDNPAVLQSLFALTNSSRK